MKPWRLQTRFCFVKYLQIQRKKDLSGCYIDNEKKVGVQVKASSFVLADVCGRNVELTQSLCAWIWSSVFRPIVYYGALLLYVYWVFYV